MRRSSSGSRRWISARRSWCAACGCPMRIALGGGCRRCRPTPTMTRSLLGMADRLRCLGVTRVVMEATSSSYWKPAVLCGAGGRPGSRPWLVNAAGRAGICGGRPETGQARLPSGCARSPSGRCIRPSLRAAAGRSGGCGTWPGTGSGPGRAPARGEERAREVLDDACIKLSVVASDIFGVSGRDMMDALIAGERSPRVLAQLARTRMRARIRRAGGGVHRALHRSPRVPAGQDARPGRRDQRRHRRARRADRGDDRPFRRTRPAGWMRSPASAPSPPRSSSPRSAPI